MGYQISFKQNIFKEGGWIYLIYGFIPAFIMYFFDKKSRKKKYESGEAIYPFGHELNKNNFPHLFRYGKRNNAILESKIKEYSKKECRGNIKLAMEFLDSDLKNKQ